MRKYVSAKPNADGTWTAEARHGSELVASCSGQTQEAAMRRATAQLVWHTYDPKGRQRFLALPKRSEAPDGKG